MSTYLQDLENELVLHPERVLVIAGAGVAMATDPSNECAGWNGLLQHGLQRCRDRCLGLHREQIKPYEMLLKNGDLMPVATFIATQLRSVRHGEYDLWLQESVGKLQLNDEQVIRALLAWGVQIATTNYDTLIELCDGRGSITWRERNLVFQFLRGDLQDVLHVHGHYRYPDTVVLDAARYEDICRDESMQTALRAVLATRTLVFVGCGSGLNDPNFGNLLTWSRQALAHSPYTHFRLVRDSEFQEIVEECQGLPVQPITYGGKYSDLGPFLETLAEHVRRRRTVAPQVELLERAHTDYIARRQRLEAERSSLPVNEYVRRRFEQARELWQIGGHRTAALDMDSLFFHQADSLARDERVRLGLDVIEMLLDDELGRSATDILQRLLRDLEAPDIPSDAMRRFRQLQIRCMNDICAYSETLAAINRAMPFAVDEEKARLQAQRAEIQLLQGELTEAIRSLDAEESI